MLTGFSNRLTYNFYFHFPQCSFQILAEYFCDAKFIVLHDFQGKSKLNPKPYCYNIKSESKQK